MGTATALAPGLSRKLKKVLETRTDTPDLLASLNTLSSFYSENTPQARRNLRSTIEKRGLSINGEFLAASGSAQQALDRVEEEVNALAECCDKIAKALSNCNATTGDIISTTERLKQELETTTQRQEIATCFLRDYQLSNDERAGLELMDMMAVYQEGAYERLCSELLRTAVRCLKARPVLFKYCAEEVANMRHNALFRRFISALTRGGPGGLPRPIEVHAHDPLRYVGDMLGWLHQALASERELVLALLDPDSTADTGPIAQRFSKIPESDVGKTESDFTFVLDRIFEGVCRPFKVRVEQVLQSQPNLIISYKLSNTLEFYSHTISDLLGRETALCNTLWALKDAAQKTTFDILKTRGEKLLRYPPLAKKPAFEPVISALLDPIIQMCEQAAEAHKSKGVIQSSRRSRVSSDPGQARRSSIDAILENSSSAPSSQIRETPSRIFLINCLCAIRQPLLGHEVASEYVKKLGSMIESQIHGLVEKEVDAVLQKCGLSNKMSHFFDSQNDVVAGESVSKPPLAEREDMAPAALSECLKAFFGLILGSENSLPEFEQMQIPSLRSEACIQLARSLAQAYEVIYKGIMDPKNGYPDPRSLARHPPDQIRTILGI
ncbi:UNVERIFIED_CONTAM: Conserved oligomeric Golgi complex subunit [Sesamum calycinum]|uniref:Conserved oligomeric Golgi complex subunit n=1 Tax=Sesamum calycinum TaxID=2727403 RepID=A0AAW2M222_9LAMI